jgi:hypothetical protein
MDRKWLIDRVSRAVRNPNWGNQTTRDDSAIALDTILDALIAEAARLDSIDAYRPSLSREQVADWLRSLKGDTNG